MSSDNGASDRHPLPLLVAEASRQLDICNACRYCEGLCAVFPALERRATLDTGDVSQLANLCHDCRACFDACMYSSPHEFGLDVPRALSAVRAADYERHVWPARVPRALSGRPGTVLLGLVSVVIVLALAVAHAGWSGLVRSSGSAASPYQLVPYPALVTLMALAALYAIVIMGLAARAYWRAVSAAGAGRVTAGAIARAAWYAATLRYLRGGGVECYYPDDGQPSPGRRHLHAMVAYGFGLCLASTVAAGIEQDLIGIAPPYPWLSVPVLSGTIGGIALLIGCLCLLRLKARSSAVTSFAEMTVKDYGLLTALAFLAASGLAVLAARDTAAYGLILLIHLAAVVEAFAMTPYSKFVHVVFRFAALVRDNLERADGGA
ncbi:MAG TPA: tricarballylate utilization 4Fe-4S protein TcuB [Trebonia sp.]|jgi:citrate/tricarballylate utilization protein